MSVKKVMLVWGAAGSGHRSGMQAIRDALIELDPSVEVIDVDVYSRPWSRFPLILVPHLYDFIVDHIPWAWHLLFRLSNSPRRARIAELALSRLVSPVFQKALRDFQPDVVVCVIHTIGAGLMHALKRVGQNPPVGMVVQDMVTTHQVYFVSGAMWFALPTQESYDIARDAGIPEDKLHLVGMPLRRIFWRDVSDRVALRRQIGLPENGPVTLVISGPGLGNLDATIDALLGADLPGHLAVIAVNDEHKREGLMCRAAGRSFSVAGRMNNVSDWMWASDLLVTKAGPNVIYEAMRCQVPVILTSAIPGQETGNLWFVEKHRVGLVAPRPAQIAAAADRILREPGLADSMKAAMKKVCRPDAAQQIAEITLSNRHSTDD